MAVKLEPTDEKKVPYSLKAEEPETYVDEIEVAGNTAELLERLGAPIEVDEAQTKKEIEALVKGGKAGREALGSPAAAIAGAAFLRQYGSQLALDAVQVRTAITYKLLEIADCGDIKYELKALELLGKHSDIGLFTERSEVTVRHTTPEGLEEAIRTRIKRLLGAEQAAKEITHIDLDAELDVAPFALRGGKEEKEVVEAEFDEVDQSMGEETEDGQV